MVIVESDKPVSKRASCRTIKSRLDKMNQRCHSDIRYGFEPAPWELEEEDAANLVAVVAPLSEIAVTASRVTNRKLRVHTGRTRTLSVTLASSS